MTAHQRDVVSAIPSVPEGKVRLCEYGQEPPGTLAEEIILSSCPRSSTPASHPVRLVYRSRGYVPAGSCLRWNDNEIWGVIFQDDRSNTTYGKWYFSREEAESHWDNATPLRYRSIELFNADPKCAHNVEAKGLHRGGGIHCTKCRGWFCY